MAVERNAIAPSFLNLVDTFLAGINNLFNGKKRIFRVTDDPYATFKLNDCGAVAKTPRAEQFQDFSPDSQPIGAIRIQKDDRKLFASPTCHHIISP